MVYWSVDRIEEGQVVLEGPDQAWVRLSLSQLPSQVREGDCLFQEAGEWRIDEEETRQRRLEAARRLRAILGKNGPNSAQGSPD